MLLSEKTGIARIRSYCHLLDILTSVKPYFLGNKFKFLTILNTGSHDDTFSGYAQAADCWIPYTHKHTDKGKTRRKKERMPL